MSSEGTNSTVYGTYPHNAWVLQWKGNNRNRAWCTCQKYTITTKMSLRRLPLIYRRKNEPIHYRGSSPPLWGRFYLLIFKFEKNSCEFVVLTVIVSDNTSGKLVGCGLKPKLWQKWPTLHAELEGRSSNKSWPYHSFNSTRKTPLASQLFFLSLALSYGLNQQQRDHTECIHT